MEQQNIDWSKWDGEFMSAYGQFGKFWQVETNIDGIIFMPLEYSTHDELEKDHPESEIEIIIGFGIHLSANGYMDQTEWTVHKSEQEAFDYLMDMYPPESEME